MKLQFLVVLLILNIPVGLLAAEAMQKINTGVASTIPASSTQMLCPAVIKPSTVDLSEIKQLIKEQGNDGLGKYLIAALSAMVGGLIAGLINWYLQHQKLKHEKEQAIKGIGIDAAKELNGLRLRQLGELYGPLKALLGQSKGVHHQLCLQLVQSDPARFRLQDDPNSTLGKSCEIYSQGKWEPFRLLYEIHTLYGNRHKIDPLVTQIIKISKSIIDVIRDKAGLALSEQSEIHDAFAKYLSHIAILEDAYQTARSPAGKRKVLGVREYSYGAYPRELNKLVDDGFCKISLELKGWETILENLSTSNSH